MYEIIIAILIGLDQIIKYWALNYLQGVESIPVINNVFNLTYVENRGAAFGMLQNNQIIFIIVEFTTTQSCALRRSGQVNILYESVPNSICSPSFTAESTTTAAYKNWYSFFVSIKASIISCF